MLALDDIRADYRKLSERLAIEVRKLMPQLRDSKWPAEANDLATLCRNAFAASEAILIGMRNGSLLEQGEDFGQSIQELENALGDVAESARNEDCRLRAEKKSDKERHAASEIARYASSARSIVEELHTQYASYYDAEPKAVWLLTGAAGTGKSHLFATMVQRVLNEGGAALMVIGEQFIDNRPVALSLISSTVCNLTRKAAVDQVCSLWMQSTRRQIAEFG
jgi:primosomal protein N'